MIMTTNSSIEKSSNRIALITGVTGQDGSYLAGLLTKGYIDGIKGSSSFNTDRIDHLYQDPHMKMPDSFHYGDLTDRNLIE